MVIERAKKLEQNLDFDFLLITVLVLVLIKKGGGVSGGGRGLIFLASKSVQESKKCDRKFEVIVRTQP